MQYKNNADNLDKYHKDGEYLSGVCHVKENAKDVNGQ